MTTRTLNATIPTIDSNLNQKEKIESNIKKIAALLPEYGITHLEAQAAFMAIVYSFCKCVPSIQSCEYTERNQLKAMFPETFQVASDQRIEQYLFWESLKKGTRDQFYSVVYDTMMDGKMVGNLYPEDSITFCPAGLIPIVGRHQYSRFQFLATEKNQNALSSASSLISNLEAATEVAALVFRDRLRYVSPSNHPGVLYNAIQLFPFAKSDDTIKYYEHFYGAYVFESFGITDKRAGGSINPNSYYGSASEFAEEYGFTDPNGIYPFNRERYQSTIPKTAQGKYTNTFITQKQATRKLGVPIANGGGSWDQPSSCYRGNYPFNRVEETESGHVIEKDDTPGYERLNIYHRKGTFHEIDCNGTEVTRIVGDNYTIIDRNGFISIDGAANVTVAGNINVMCLSNANVEVNGSARMDVHGDMNIGVGKDFNLACQGNISMAANGGFNLQGCQNSTIFTKKQLFVTSDENTSITTKGALQLTSNDRMDISCHDQLRVSSDKQFDVSCSDDLKLTSGGYFDLSSGDNFAISSGGRVDITQVGDFNHSVGGIYQNTTTGTVQFKGAYIDINSTLGLTIGAVGPISLSGLSTVAVSGTMGASFSSTGLVGINGAFVGFNSGISIPTLPNVPTLPAGGATKAASAKDGERALLHGMVPPEPASALNPFVPPLPSIEPYGEGSYVFETEDDCNSAGAALLRSAYTTEQGNSNLFQGCSNNDHVKLVPEPNDTTIITELLHQDPSTFNSQTKISDHFTLGMLFDGGFNNKHVLQNQCDLNVNQIVGNLSRLACNVLEKYLDVLPGGIEGYGTLWRINSGYRAGNFTRSDHNRGCACDIKLINGSKADHYNLICKLQHLSNFDQLLLEYLGTSGVWIHVGYRNYSYYKNDTKITRNNRMQRMTFVNHSKRTDGFTMFG